jgi:hypothetical protein
MCLGLLKGLQEMFKKVVWLFCKKIFLVTFAPLFKQGAIAQLVEHRTENPGVPGSIPGGTTETVWSKSLESEGLYSNCFFLLQTVSPQDSLSNSHLIESKSEQESRE